MKHTDKSQSRRVTPWDDNSEPTPSQRFITQHYQGALYAKTSKT